MFDPSAHHPEPFGEAMSHSSQRAAQLVSLLAAAAEVAMRRRALHAAQQAARDEQKWRMLQAQESAFRAQARAGWAPALDARWLAQADLLRAGRAWGAAAPWADTDPEAAAALRRTEERLRTLHPYAMDRYDRLRSGGTRPLDAMREAVHLFAREPHARPGEPASERPAVEVGQPAPDPGVAHGSSGQPDSGLDYYQDAERRGRLIVERLQARAVQGRGVELSPGELATVLEASTSLPAEVIAQLARAEAEERVIATAERARAADLGHAANAPSAHARADDLKAARRDTLTADTAGAHASADRTAAQLAAESFPRSAAEGIRAAASGQLQPTQTADRATTGRGIRRISVSQ